MSAAIAAMTRPALLETSGTALPSTISRTNATPVSAERDDQDAVQFKVQPPLVYCCMPISPAPVNMKLGQGSDENCIVSRSNRGFGGNNHFSVGLPAIALLNSALRTSGSKLT